MTSRCMGLRWPTRCLSLASHRPIIQSLSQAHSSIRRFSTNHHTIEHSHSPLTNTATSETTDKSTNQSVHPSANHAINQSTKPSPVDHLFDESDPPGWRVLIGLEVHAQIDSRSKLFSSASTKPTNQSSNQSNSQVDAIDAALPGMLPSLNLFCLNSAIQLGVAISGKIQKSARFERKHYFYCDLPQGYQITQSMWPVVIGGHIDVPPSVNQSKSKQLSKRTTVQSIDQPTTQSADQGVTRVRINRIQIEQDSGKNLHDLSSTLSHVDLNRAGVGLLEIVTEPDMKSGIKASDFVRRLAEVLRSLGVSRCQMEDGSMRVDVNISVHYRPDTSVKHSVDASSRFNPNELIDGERVEVKNINSLRQIIEAVEYEKARQVELYENGSKVNRETRTWDAKSHMTHLLRSKENMLDYRFMIDPDLPELRLSDEYIDHLIDTMPELHDDRLARLTDLFSLSSYEANVLASEPGAVEYFERLVYGEDHQPNHRAYQKSIQQSNGQSSSPQKFLRTPRACCNWLTNELFGQINRARSNQSMDSSIDAIDDGGSRVFLLTDCPVSSQQLGGLIDLIEQQVISGKHGKMILTKMLSGDLRDAKSIATAENFVQVSDASLINRLADQVCDEHRPAIVEHQTKPNPRLSGFLTGQLIKASKGKANPKEAAKAIQQRLSETPQ